MNREALKQRIYTDHRQLDAEALEQIRQDPALRAELEAVRHQDAQLRAAHEQAAPDGLLDDILQIPRTHLTEDSADTGQDGKPGWLRWVLAIPPVLAAVALGIFAITSYQNNPIHTVESYLAEHYDEDGRQVLQASIQGMPPATKQALMQRVGLDARPGFDDAIEFVKACPTPGGPGAHMVVSTPSGLATVIYMPNIELKAPRELTIGSQQVEAAPLERGSIAVMAADRETAEQLMQRARSGFITGLRT